MTNINDIKKLESKGGDKKRSLTSFVLIGITLPFLLLACTLPLFFDTTTWSGIDILSDVYLSIFLLSLLCLLIYGIYEATNFIFPKENYNKENPILLITLSIFVSIPFLFQCLSLLGITSGEKVTDISMYIGLLLIGLIIFIIISSVMQIDFKDISTLMFMSVMFYLFIAMLAHNVIVSGWQIVILIIALTIISDTMAYFGGKAYGNKKIFPNISPNKTVEGFMIGLMSSISFGVIFFMAFFTWDSGFLSNGEITDIFSKTSMWWLLIIIIIISIVAPFGDLVFSKIKRSYGKKDFSNILPGHGGLFDRLDSHIFTMTTGTLLIMILI